jgi:hypothetical protein
LGHVDRPQKQTIAGAMVGWAIDNDEGFKIAQVMAEGKDGV